MRYGIVGNGLAAITAAQAIARADGSATVTIFGQEPYPYYRRPLLPKFVAGLIEQDALYFRPPAWYDEQGFSLHLGVRAVSLDPEAHLFALQPGSERVKLEDSTFQYDRLLIAVGSRAFVPPCQGTEKQGVFSLRTLEDALKIKAYLQDISTALVVGGGLLGLEAARALHTAGLKVTVIESFPHLLHQQLDAEGAAVLQALLEDQGLQVIEDVLVETVLGAERASGLRFQDGRTISGEMVLFCTGIRCEVALAREAGLAVQLGIVCDSHMQTSAPDVFAAGDVAEFKGAVYGVIPAAVEQAQAAAANMVALGSTFYTGTLPMTTLKVAGAELTSLGECLTAGDDVTVLYHVDLDARHYRKLVLRDGTIVGAILLNDKERAGTVTQLIKRGVDVSPHTQTLLDDGFDLKSLLS